MAGYKETPRQKMIGMMYLVLTALLALNVSKEILDAFVVVNKGLVKTNEILFDKNDDLFSEFAKQHTLKPEKVEKYFRKAEKAKKYSDDLITYIKDVKRELIAYTEFKDNTLKTGEYKDKDGKLIKNVPLEDFPLEHIGQKSNYDKPWEKLGGNETGTKGRAIILKEMFTEYKTNMLNLIEDTAQRAGINLGLDTDDKFNEHMGRQMNWMYNTFYHTVLYADIVLLNKYITDVHNAQIEITNTLIANITKEDFKFNKISAKAIPFSNYVITGEEYKADIFVAAYDTLEAPEVYIKMDADTFLSSDITQDNKIDSIYRGMAKLNLKASSVGEKKYAGIIRIKKPNSTLYDEHFFRNIYTVASPTAVVAPMSMMVLYIGVENPLAISVPGVPQNKISPSATGPASLRADGGNYTIKPIKGQTEITINVGYTNATGERKVAGSQVFKVKKVPDPIAEIAGKTQGDIAKQKLLVAGGIIASMKGFEFDLKFTVISYKMTMTVGGRTMDYPAKNNRFTADMKKQIQGIKRGTSVAFSFITVRGSDGTTRTIPPIAFIVN